MDMQNEDFNNAKSQRMWAGAIGISLIWWGGYFWQGLAFDLWITGMIGLAAVWRTKDAFDKAFNVDPRTGEPRKPLGPRDDFPHANPKPWAEPNIRRVYPKGDNLDEHVRREL